MAYCDPMRTIVITLTLAFLVGACTSDSSESDDGLPDPAPETTEASDATQPADTAEVAEDVTPPPPPGLVSSPPLGDVLCVAGVPGGGERQTLGVEALTTAGVHWIRTGLTWGQAEPTKGTFTLEKLESRVGPYLATGKIDVIALLAYGNPWATTATEDDQYYPPDDPADFAAYVDAVVTWFDGRISRFEIWNEENAGYRFWKPTVSGDPEAYGALLIAAVAAGRTACPGCEFAFGGPFFHSQIIDGHIPFLQATQEAHPGLADSYDVMGFHPYSVYPPETAPEGEPPDYEWSIATMVAGVRAVMDEQGAGERPFWTTEVGWPVYANVDADLQAAFLVRAVLQLSVEGAHPVCWYNLYEGPNPESFPPEHAFGLFTHGDLGAGVMPEPKPAYHALSQLGNRFAAHRIVRDLRAAGQLPEGAYGFQLDGAEPSDRWWVVWAYPETVAIPLPVAPSEVLDMVGGALDPARSSSAVTAGAAPIFLRVGDHDIDR